VRILSIFISSYKIYLLLNIDGQITSESFDFYPFFQTKEGIEFLVKSYLKSRNLHIDDLLILPISTSYDLPIFNKKVKYLSDELKGLDITYIYFDNLTFYSQSNFSASHLGLTNRLDNFISNRSIYSVNKFTGDIEEIVYLSKSITNTYKPDTRKVVFGGDYFTNSEIPNEFKLNFISEVLSNGFYELYIDSKNEYPNFVNLRNNSSLNLKSVEFEEFGYLVSSDRSAEILLESSSKHKYLNLKNDNVFYLHFKDLKDLKLKLKGKDFKQIEVSLNTNFPGMLIDLRTSDDKKKNLGIESFRKVLNSIEKEYDYASI